MSSTRQFIGLVVFVLMCLLVAGFGGAFTATGVESWYAFLRKPAWTPPNWVFGPVWTVLYLSMAVAAWLVWRKAKTSAAAIPLAMFGLQLALNLVWSAIFFGLSRTGLALVDILVLWLAILATMIAFWRIAPLAGWLLVPYLAWVSYAAALNYEIWRLNRG